MGDAAAPTSGKRDVAIICLDYGPPQNMRFSCLPFKHRLALGGTLKKDKPILQLGGRVAHATGKVPGEVNVHDIGPGHVLRADQQIPRHVHALPVLRKSPGKASGCHLYRELRKPHAHTHTHTHQARLNVAVGLWVGDGKTREYPHTHHARLN